MKRQTQEIKNNIEKKQNVIENMRLTGKVQKPRESSSKKKKLEYFSETQKGYFRIKKEIPNIKIPNYSARVLSRKIELKSIILRNQRNLSNRSNKSSYSSNAYLSSHNTPPINLSNYLKVTSQAVINGSHIHK